MEIKHNFKELKIWQKSRLLTTKIFKLTMDFPKEEKYGLINQMRRSAVSIASNIAKGSGRNSDKEFCRFLDIALGSAYELETQIIISSDLNYLREIDNNDLLNDIEEIQKMTYVFRKTLIQNSNE
jgi:four helix bundle protein